MSRLILNKTEEQAYKWLLKQGLIEKDIIYQASKTPSFLCADGAEYDVKRLYGDLIWLYDNQLQNLKSSNANIIVMREGVSDPIAIIPSKLIENDEVVHGIKVKVVRFLNRSPISLHEGTITNLIKIKGQMELENGKIKSLNIVVDKLIEDFWKTKNISNDKAMISKYRPVDIPLQDSRKSSSRDEATQVDS